MTRDELKQKILDDVRSAPNRTRWVKRETMNTRPSLAAFLNGMVADGQLEKIDVFKSVVGFKDATQSD